MARAATPSAPKQSPKLTKVVAINSITYGKPVLDDDGSPYIVEKKHGGVTRKVPLTENVTVLAGQTFEVDAEHLKELRSKKLVRAPDPVLDEEEVEDEEV